MAILRTCFCCVSIASALQGSAPQVSASEDAMSPCPQLDHRTLLDSQPLQAVLARSGASPGKGCAPANPLHAVKHHADIGRELRRHNLTGLGVEVGVQAGEFTEQLLQNWGQADLYIQVDLWRQQDTYKDEASADHAQQVYRKDWRRMDESCQRGLGAVGKKQARKVVQCQDYPAACAKFFPDSSLDFVFLDMHHDKKGVLEDLTAYWPKVRPGGVIAGREYRTQDDSHGPQDKMALSKHQSHRKRTTKSDATVDTSPRAIMGAINDFFGGSKLTPADLKHCPRQLATSYGDVGLNTWMVGK